MTFLFLVFACFFSPKMVYFCWQVYIQPYYSKFKTIKNIIMHYVLQMGEGYKMTVDELVKTLRVAISWWLIS